MNLIEFIELYLLTAACEALWHDHAPAEQRNAAARVFHYRDAAARWNAACAEELAG